MSRQFWINYYGSNAWIAYSSFKRAEDCSDSEREIIHVIEYSAYEQLKSKLSETEDKLYHASRLASENEYLRQHEANERDKLRFKLEIAEDALEFYANKSSYTQISPDFGYSIVKLNIDDYIEGWNDKIGYTTKTGGKRAREALQDIRKKDEK